MEVIFIRHTEKNETGEDPYLTKKGVKQAKRLSKKFKKEKFDEFYCSDMKRAKQTAEIIAEGKKYVEKYTSGFEELKKEIPAGLLDILNIEGMGPKRTKELWQAFKITNVEKLKELCKTGKLSKRKGWGPKSVNNISGFIWVVFQIIQLIDIIFRMWYQD